MQCLKKSFLLLVFILPFIGICEKSQHLEKIVQCFSPRMDTVRYNQETELDMIII